MSATTSGLFSHKVIVLSNAFVNARFALSMVETRLLLAMLARIERSDTEFQEMRIPLRELIGLSGRRFSKKDYQQLEIMSERLAKRAIRAWPLHGKPIDPARVNNFELITLLAYARYNVREGFLRVRFNNEVQPYLLQLNQNFTQVRITQLLKLKSTVAHRIYFLLKQFADFGKRLIELNELKRILGIEGKYKQKSLFCLRVLDRAQQELSTTDLPFDYELLPESKGVTLIRFSMQVRTALVAEPEQPPVAASPVPPANSAAGCEQSLRELGLAARSIAIVADQLQHGQLTPAYVQFVIKKQREGQAAGKIKNLAGAIFYALGERQFVPEFEAQNARRQSNPLAAAQRRKTQGLLEEARNSLAFILTSYEGEERQRYEAQARAHIALYESQLQRTG
jgi:hypothetical protein